MKVLALDTSNRPLSVALLEDESVLASVTLTVHQKHAEYLLPVIEDLMAKSEVKPADLDRVVVAEGPGSYTGIRIGVTTAKTLADTLNIELVGVSSLRALALNSQREGGLVWPIFDARNNNVFTGLYRMEKGVPVSVIEDQHVDFDEFMAKVVALDEPTIVVGDGQNFADRLDTHFELLTGFDNLPQVAKLGMLGEQLAPVADITSFVPNYLRLTQAEADWRKQHPEEDAGSYVEKKFKVWYDNLFQQQERQKRRELLDIKNHQVEIRDTLYFLAKAQFTDIPEILGIERAVYGGKTPWDSSAFAAEINRTLDRLYIVLRRNDRLLAFVGCSFDQSKKKKRM